MQRKTIILCAAVVLLVIAACLLRPKSTGYTKVVVRVNGVVTHTLPLDRDAVLTIDTPNGHNRLVIAGGAFYMDEADCPDHLCIDQGAVSPENCAERPLGASVICLPHKVTVTLE